MNYCKLGLGALLLALVPAVAEAFTLDLFQDVSSDPGFNTGTQELELIWDNSGSSQSGTSSVSDLSGVQWGTRTLNLNIESK